MIQIKFLMIFLIGFLWASLAFPKNSYAYLDPGSGSYLLQLLIAGLLAASFTVKSFWRNVLGFFTGLFSKKKKDAGNTR